MSLSRENLMLILLIESSAQDIKFHVACHTMKDEAVFLISYDLSLLSENEQTCFVTNSL